MIRLPRVNHLILLGLLASLSLASGQTTVTRIDECDYLFGTSPRGWEIVYHTSQTDPRPAAGLISTQIPTITGGALIIPQLAGAGGQIWLKAPAAFLTDLSRFSRVEIQLADDPSNTPGVTRLDGTHDFFFANANDTALISQQTVIEGVPRRVNAAVEFSELTPSGIRQRTPLGTTFPETSEITDFYIRLDSSALLTVNDHRVLRIRKSFVVDTDWQTTGLGWTSQRTNNLANPLGTGTLSEPVPVNVMNGEFCVSNVATVNSPGSIEWMRAPASLLGDWRDTFELRLRGITNSASSSDQDILFLITDGTNSATITASSTLVPIINQGLDPVDIVAVPVDRSFWNISGNWDDLIQNVSELFIRIDLSQGTSGGDYCIDSFERVDCLSFSTVTVIPSTTVPATHARFVMEPFSIVELETSTDLDIWNFFESYEADDSPTEVEECFDAVANPVQYFRLLVDVDPGTEEPQEESISLDPEFSEVAGLTTVTRSLITANDPTTISEALISDSNQLSGAPLAYSGFDLDFIFFDPDGDLATTGGRIFPTGFNANLGTQREFDSTSTSRPVFEGAPLFGTTNGEIDMTIATLDTLDANYSLPNLAIADSTGFLSLGDGGSISVTFPDIFLNPGESTFLMIGEAGNQDGETLNGSAEALVEIATPITIPRLQLDSAAIVRFDSEVGTNYQVQVSPDGATWTNVGTQISGDGSTLERCFILTEVTGRLFRVIQP